MIKNISPRAFKEGDLILKKLELHGNPVSEGKLAPNWEDPFRVTKHIEKEAYKLDGLMEENC